MKKYLIIGAIVVVGVAILIFGIFSRLDKSVAKENRFPLLKAIVKLHTTGREMVPVIPFNDGNGVHSTAYVVRTNAGHDPIIKFMEEQGWRLTDQFGSSLSFEKDGKQVTVGYQQIITRHYRLFVIPNLE